MLPYGELGLSFANKELYGKFCDRENCKFGQTPMCFSSSKRNKNVSPSPNIFNVPRNGPRFKAPSLKLDFSATKFLRVLDLEGISVKHLPDEVGDLIHLRYVGLRNTGVRRTFRRWGGCILADSKIVRGLRKLTLLEELQLQLERSEDGKALCTSIQSVASLRFLLIASKHPDSTPLQIEDLSPSQTTLELLALNGPLAGQKLPMCVVSLHSLVVLLLSYTKITQDPFAILHKLPKLMGLL
ncbi:hypothetical protein AMTRI_Chr09g17700 [Amborella trichopoda]